MSAINIIEPPKPFSQILPRCGHIDLFSAQLEADEVTYNTEIESVACGLRDANIFHMRGDSFDTQINFLLDKGLVFLPIRRGKTYNSFSSKFYDTPTLDKDSMSYGVIARDLDTAKKFKEFDESNDHVSIGNLLGYPECCSRAFAEYIKRSLDPVFDIAINTNGSARKEKKTSVIVTDPFPEILVHYRYFGFKIIPWLPCNFRCEESYNLSKEWINISKKMGNIEKILEILSNLPSSWSLYNCQVLVNGPGQGIDNSLLMGYATSCYVPDKLEVTFTNDTTK